MDSEVEDLLPVVNQTRRGVGLEEARLQELLVEVDLSAGGAGQLIDLDFDAFGRLAEDLLRQVGGGVAGVQVGDDANDGSRENGQTEQHRQQRHAERVFHERPRRRERLASCRLPGRVLFCGSVVDASVSSFSVALYNEGRLQDAWSEGAGCSVTG
jgi:hypothetical protein